MQTGSSGFLLGILVSLICNLGLLQITYQTLFVIIYGKYEYNNTDIKIDNKSINMVHFAWR